MDYRPYKCTTRIAQHAFRVLTFKVGILIKGPTINSYIDSLRCFLSGYMRGSRKFCQRGSNFDNDFYVFHFSLTRGGRIQIPLLADNRSTAHQRNAIRWQANDCQTLNAGLVAL